MRNDTDNFNTLKSQGTDDSLEKWISQTGTGNIAGADPNIVGAGDWLDWEKVLEEGGVELVTLDNLIDNVWTEDNGRPTPEFKVSFTFILI